MKNNFDIYSRSDMEIDAYDMQIWNAENWAPAALELADSLRDDEAKMAAMLEALRLTLDNGERQNGIKALLDLVHPARQKCAERAVARACGVGV